MLIMWSIVGMAIILIAISFAFMLEGDDQRIKRTIILTNMEAYNRLIGPDLKIEQRGKNFIFVSRCSNGHITETIEYRPKQASRIFWQMVGDDSGKNAKDVFDGLAQSTVRNYW